MRRFLPPAIEPLAGECRRRQPRKSLSRFLLSWDHCMSELIEHFCRDERGATATEYALLIVFVAVGIAAGANILGTNISNLFNEIGTELSKLNPALPPLP